ncbi:MAG: hypothetical protein LBQ73_06750 [Tannerellaceae bacterium]|nr:hypothetical protein [Tannerellaceae bacterium]
MENFKVGQKVICHILDTRPATIKTIYRDGTIDIAYPGSRSWMNVSSSNVTPVSRRASLNHI